jgi:2-polyprenyl-6-methoxyphenol hydroxylase-like FAD-dependent oxidoreductase
VNTGKSKYFGNQPQAGIPMRPHAIVIGGSMAGLLAARVLADHFEQVSIVDRDTFPARPEPRKGLPQSRHVHVLLWRGQLALERLFPGLQAALERAGAPPVDWIGEARFFSFGGWAPRYPSSYLTHPCSRDLLEWAIRGRLSKFPQVRFLEGQEANGLLSNESRSHITGLRLRDRNRPQQGETELQSDLVVDASGRASRTPAWLEGLGYPAPGETLVNSFLGYATRLYQRPVGFAEWKMLVVRGTASANSRGGVINPVEGGRWMVTLAGVGGDYPPTDEAGFLEFARSLDVPNIYEALQAAEPLSPISGYRKTENRWRHYERLARLPENLALLGDAVCAFNPIYGEGMSVAALEALALEQCLSERGERPDLDGLGRDFQRQATRAIAGSWLLATGEDYRYPKTEGGRRSPVTRLVHRYMDRLMTVSNHDPQVFDTFFQVGHLIQPVSAFFKAEIVLKVLYGSR